MINLKLVFSRIITPEVSLISLFLLMGYVGGSSRIDPGSDITMILFIVLVCYFLGSKLLTNVVATNYEKSSKTDRLFAFVGFLLMLVPPIVGYMQGMRTFIALDLMLILILVFQVGNRSLQNKIKSLPGLNIFLQSLIWGSLSIAVGSLYSGLEPTTRGWLIVLLGFYLYASFNLLSEVLHAANTSKLATYLGDSKSLELVAIFQLFGVVGLTTLYLSELDYIVTTSLIFYVLFTFFSLVGIFQTLVWAKNPMAKRVFNYRFYLINFNISTLTWIIAEWISIS